MAAETRALWLYADGLAKRYGGVLALDGASLAVRPGEVHGLVGANGAGKSTFVKCLTGMVRPTNGTVHVGGRSLQLGRPVDSLRAGIASVPQELTVAPTLTVAANVMLGHEPRRRIGLVQDRELSRRAAEALESVSLDVPLDAQVGQLPLMEQRLVMIARALSFDARLVIFDEPTATLSPHEAALLLETVRALAGRGVSVLYVSHHLREIETVCDSVTVLRDGRVIADLERATHARLVELLAPEDGWRASVDREKLVAGDVVVHMRSVTGPRLRDVSLAVREGEVVGLAGLAGSGAREVLLTLCGAAPFTAGSIVLGGRRLRSGNSRAAVNGGVGFLPGDRSLGTFPTHVVRHNVALPSLRRYARLGFVDRGREKSTVAGLLDRVALRASTEAPITSLSGGNQQKALVARWIGANPRLLLLDDPTAGVDVATRPEIHAQIRLLSEAGVAVLLASTDAAELAELSDRVVVFERGTVTAELMSEVLTPARVLAAMTGQAQTSGPPLEGGQMTDTTAEQSPPPPVVSDAQAQEIAASVYVIPDGRVPLVPNIGIVVGEHEALVVDTGMGLGNGRRVLARARALTDKPLLLTVTHFHPEHGYGAKVFADEGVRIVYNRAQQEELAAKGRAYLDMFRTFGDAVAEQLEGVEFVEPDELYDDRSTLDLGGCDVELLHFGLAHTRGDQVVFLPEQRVLFAGDLLENRIFPIFPWFPPDDADVNGSRWIDVLDRLEELKPSVVVPGHGEVTGPELIGQVRSYLQDVRARVAAAEGTVEEVKAALEPAIQADYPDWDAPEWIGFAISCFHAELHG